MTVADLFCGAGGATSGVVVAARRARREPLLLGINHSALAIRTHGRNHPEARHLCVNLDGLDVPRVIQDMGMKEIDLLWASPSCTHHSRARGGKPVDDQTRSTAWCVIRWAEAGRPKVILVENVAEFADWGPIDARGHPIKTRKGALFRQWVATLETLGYRVAWRVLCAADYGAPTTRRRLIIQAVRGPRPIVWPARTHAPADEIRGDLFGAGLRPWVPAADIIDWDIPGTSIFARKRPLAEATLRRIFVGLERYGLAGHVVAWDHQSGTGLWPASQPLSTISTKARHGVARPFLVPVGYGERAGQTPRAHPANEPLPTVVGSGKHALAEPYLINLRGTQPGQLDGSARPITGTLPTISAGGIHAAVLEPYLIGQQSCAAPRPVREPAPTVSTAGAIALARPYLVEYYGTGTAASAEEPLPTVTTRARYALAEALLLHCRENPGHLPVLRVDGRPYALDIRFRMLRWHELARAMGFPSGFEFAGNDTQKVAQIGNAVPPPLSEALVRAQIEAGNL